jgi:hypothetical protein
VVFRQGVAPRFRRLPGTCAAKLYRDFAALQNNKKLKRKFITLGTKSVQMVLVCGIAPHLCFFNGLLMPIDKSTKKH